MLLLGRLDGRLQNSPWADIWLARARLQGAAQLAGLAGVPIDVRHLQDWICGRTPPPRASEGLNDPVSVAAVFHLAASRDEDSDPVLQATLNVLRTIFDDRGAAETWAGDDLAYFGPLWRQVRDETDRPLDEDGMIAIARRAIEMATTMRDANPQSATVTTIDGRTLTLPARSRDRVWLIAAAIPRLLCRAGLTTRIIPSLILLPKTLPPSAEALATMMEAALAVTVAADLRTLDRVERAGASLTASPVTRRSRAPLLARLALAYPGLQPRAVSHLLGVTPQGARKLLAGLAPRTG